MTAGNCKACPELPGRRHLQTAPQLSNRPNEYEADLATSVIPNMDRAGVQASRRCSHLHEHESRKVPSRDRWIAQGWGSWPTAVPDAHRLPGLRPGTTTGAPPSTVPAWAVPILCNGMHHQEPYPCTAGRICTARRRALRERDRRSAASGATPVAQAVDSRIYWNRCGAAGSTNLSAALLADLKFSSAPCLDRCHYYVQPASRSVYERSHHLLIQGGRRQP